jgi:hypothetical protein
MIVVRSIVVIGVMFLATSIEAQKANSGSKTIHVIVAWCDNEYQGIVPVPKHLGDGDNPATNLYWGATYGVKNFFKRSEE